MITYRISFSGWRDFAFKLLVACIITALIFYLRIKTPFDHSYPYNVREKTLSIYEQAELSTGAPAHFLKGIAHAESSEGRKMNHPNKDDIGMFGLHETKEIHAYRARLFGEYDAADPHDSAYVTGMLFMTSLESTKSEAIAICSHHQGPKGVLRDGLDEKYLNMVIRGME